MHVGHAQRVRDAVRPEVYDLAKGSVYRHTSHDVLSPAAALQHLIVRNAATDMDLSEGHEINLSRQRVVLAGARGRQIELAIKGRRVS